MCAHGCASMHTRIQYSKCYFFPRSYFSPNFSCLNQIMSSISPEKNDGRDENVLTNFCIIQVGEKVRGRREEVRMKYG